MPINGVAGPIAFFAPPIGSRAPTATVARTATFAPAAATLPRPAPAPEGPTESASHAAVREERSPEDEARFQSFLAVAREERLPEQEAGNAAPAAPLSAEDARQRLDEVTRSLDESGGMNEAARAAGRADALRGPGFHRSNVDRDIALASRRQANRADIDLDRVVENAERARSTGVNAAKSNFWKRFAGAAFSVALTGLMTAFAVASGGALLIAGAAMMGALALQASADTFYAHRMVVNERAVAEGRSPPYELPMGDNAIGNWIHAALPSSWSPEERSKFAGKASGLLTFALGAGTFVVAGWANLAWVTAGIALSVGVEVLRARADPLARPDLHEADGKALARYTELAAALSSRQADIERMANALASMPSDSADHVRLREELAARRAAFEAEAQPIFDAMEREVERMALRVENATTLRHAPAATATARLRDGATPVLSIVPDVAQTGVSYAGASYYPVVAGTLRLGRMGIDALRVHAQRNERAELLRTHEQAIAELVAQPFDPRFKA